MFLTTIIPKSVLSKNMPDLTVRDCVNYLRIVLTEFIQIAPFEDKHIMLNKYVQDCFVYVKYQDLCVTINPS